MSNLSFLGDSLVSKTGKINTSDALSGKKAIALYFSAHWCPPCRGFTPKLAEWYAKDLQAKGLEVIFVSSDRDENAFNEYYGEQPWLALPFEDRARKEELSTKYKVNGIPSLVILDSEGNTITTDGRSAITADPTGEDMPWKPKSLAEIMDGAKMINKDGATIDGSTLMGTVHAFYFSAHWCPPCRAFTPKAADWYTNDLKAKGLEIVFVSSDRDEPAFKEYYGEQPWLALEFDDRKRKEQLSTLFHVNGIPCLVVIDKDGTTITTNGTSALAADPQGAEFPWYPKPVNNLRDGPGDINDIPTVIVFCETQDEAAQLECEAALTAVAQPLMEHAKARKLDPEYNFLIVTDDAAGLANRIRGMMNLPKAAGEIETHKHPLALFTEGGDNWGCDGCGESGVGKTRYKCTEGCNFDYCGECFAAQGKPREQEPQSPRLVLLDIPDNGGYYMSPEGPITSETVERFLADHKNKNMERKQLE